VLIKTPFKKGMGPSIAPYYKTAGGAAFTGLIDVKSGALRYWGLRAASAAKATALVNCIDIVDQAGANPLTVTVLANGNLDIASINTWVTAHSVSTIKITQLYEQLGSTEHAVQATLANMPTLILSDALANSRPAINFDPSVSPQGLIVAGSPFYEFGSISWVGYRIGTTLGQVVSGSSGASIGSNAAATGLYSGVSGTLSPAQSDGSPHAAQFVLNGASAFVNIDGSVTSGTVSGGAGDYGSIFGKNASFPYTGRMFEAGYWGGFFTGPVAGDFFTSGEASSLRTNQSAYFGTP